MWDISSMKEPDASKQATRRVLRFSEMILFSLTQVVFCYQLSQNEMFNFRKTDNKCPVKSMILIAARNSWGI